MQPADNLGEETTTAATSSALVDCGDVTTLARLSIHIRQNNIAYLIGSLVAYQMGILDKMFSYGSGLC